MKKSRILSKWLLGNRGSLRSHGGNLRNCMKFEEVVEIEEEYENEEEAISKRRHLN
jgi:hypothetical protein